MPRLKEFQTVTGWNRSKVWVYVLVGFNTTFEQDLERIYTIRDIGFSPYVMIYNKENLPKGHQLRKLQRWTNAPMIFNKTRTFNEYVG